MGPPYVGDYAKYFKASSVVPHPRSKSVLNGEKNKEYIRHMNPEYHNEENNVLDQGDHDLDFEGVRPNLKAPKLGKESKRAPFAPGNVFGGLVINENRFTYLGEIKEMNSKFRNTSPDKSPNFKLSE